MSKGKGDSQTSQISLPPEIEALAKRNLKAAETAGKIGYTPYQGPTVAALDPMQVNSMQQNAGAMRAFGLTPAPVAIPTPTTYAGGVKGYDPMALYTAARAKIDPHQAAQIEKFVSHPKATAKAAAKVAAAKAAAPRRAGPNSDYARKMIWDWNFNGGGFRPRRAGE